ncbi:MAG: NADH-quinone oxidoreductase subunit C [Nitrososphaerota archaeon]
MNEDEIITSLKNRFGERVHNSKIAKPRRVYVEVDASIIREALSYMRGSLGFDHLSTITGLDSEERIELIYHIVCGNSIVVSMKTNVLKTNPKIGSISDIYVTAELYEREVYDLLGVRFEEHPNLSRLILPEDWPENLHPLRKEAALEQIKSRLSMNGDGINERFND